MKKEDVVCLCNFIFIQQIQELINENKTLEEIQEITYAGKTCGKCLTKLKELIEQNNKI